MKITRICFRELRTGLGYNNRAFEAEATLEDGDDPIAVRHELVAWVQVQHEQEKQIDELRRWRDSLASEVQRLTAERDALRVRVDAGNAIIRKHEKLAALGEERGFIDKQTRMELGDQIPF